jgi:hypothetical protein
MAKRNTAATAVVQYEIEHINGTAYGGLRAPYSDCFRTEDVRTSPVPATGGDPSACGDSSFTLRADVSYKPGPRPNTQLWSISVFSWPTGAQVGATVSTVKDNR